MHYYAIALRMHFVVDVFLLFFLVQHLSCGLSVEWVIKEMHGCLKRLSDTLYLKSIHVYFETKIKFSERFSTAPIWQHIFSILNDITSWKKWLKMLIITVKKSSLCSIKVEPLQKKLVSFIHRIISVACCTFKSFNLLNFIFVFLFFFSSFYFWFPLFSLSKDEITIHLNHLYGNVFFIYLWMVPGRKYSSDNCHIVKRNIPFQPLKNILN